MQKAFCIRSLSTVVPKVLISTFVSPPHVCFDWEDAILLRGSAGCIVFPHRRDLVTTGRKSEAHKARER